MKKTCLTLTIPAIISIFFCFAVPAKGQNVLNIDASNVGREVKAGNLKMGNPGPAGHELLINNQYLTIGGKPVIPVMGEMHYSRYPQAQWEDAILKMKANGINIISFYIIWIHHEEIEGQFDWSGNKDIRSFIMLCKKHGMLVYPRIGPWAHGEVRNGGIPDWILKKKFLAGRSNDPVYQSYAEEYIRQVAGQMHGLMYKDGGPVIGIQLENEYSGGNDHILWLKETVQKYGLDVPVYSVTGWDNASVPENEVIPFWGAYPSAPWNSDTEKISRNYSFEFSYNQNDDNIGNEAKKISLKTESGNPDYPFFTCELGVGNQVTEHRRPVFNKFDGLAIVTTKIGSGSNLPGYYVFTGGSNPEGILSSMEENREETGYWNSYPKISYDFQAAIKETGELAPSYYQVKKVHYFLNEFGSLLAPMIPVIARVNEPMTDLQYSVRVMDNSGFLFGSNYYRGTQKPVQSNIQFNVKLKNENLLFPEIPVDIPDSSTFIWPFNFKMDNIILKYATAQLLCRIEKKMHTDWFFIQNFGIQPELCFDADGVKAIESKTGKISKIKNKFIITGLRPGLQNIITITGTDGKEHHVIVLSFNESDHVWLFNVNREKYLYISDANLYLNKNVLHAYGPGSTIRLIQLSDDPQIKNYRSKSDASGNYKEYEFEVPSKKFIPSVTHAGILAGSERLKASVKLVNASNQLYNKLFIKEFSLDNPSAIRSAKLYINPDISCRIEINNHWLNQEIMPSMMNQLDITGYVQKGNNQVMIDFPYNEGNKSFQAKILVEYMNSDEIAIVSNKSWLTVEQYTIPSGLTDLKGLAAPEIIADTTASNNFPNQHSDEYMITIPDNYLEGLNQLYLHINYTGDAGELRFGHKLISDNFNNFTPWQISLKQFGDQIEGQQLKLELFPFKPDFKIYFDRKPDKEEIEKTSVKSISFIPEYSIDLQLDNQAITEK